MPEARFEMCPCGQHGFLTRPSGIQIKIWKKQQARDKLNDLWKSNLVNAATYISVRNQIEHCPLSDGGTGVMQPDDPALKIADESAIELYAESIDDEDDDLDFEPTEAELMERRLRLN